MSPLASKVLLLGSCLIFATAPWQAGAAEPTKTTAHAVLKPHAVSKTRVDGDPPLAPRRPEIPPIKQAGEHPIDRFLDAYFVKQELAWPKGADDATFLRRVHLDLVGLLPMASEVDAFVADSAPDKRSIAIDALLNDRRAYADHWLSFWNDLLRNDYVGVGYTDGGRKQLTPWLYQSLRDNKPYDQFVRELINPVSTSEAFVFGIKWRGRANASQSPEVQFSQNLSQVFFGVNMKCASCHDSFIDHWKLDEAYALAAVVANDPLPVYRCDKETGRTASARFLWPELGSIDTTAARDERLKQLSFLATHPENGRFARTLVNRVWQRLFGRGLIEPVDVMANAAWNQDLLDYLASHLVEQKYDVQQLLRHVCSSRAYQARVHTLDAEPNSAYVFHGPQLKRLTAEQFVDAVWMLTGAAPDKPHLAVTVTNTVRPKDKDGKTAKLEPEFDLPKAANPEREFIRAALVRSDLLMRSLGRPNREQVVTTRGQQLTTLQALDLSNGEILHSTLLRGAATWRKQHPEPAALVRELWRQALSRAPTGDELTTAVELLGEKPDDAAVADLLWAVVMLPEFQLIH